MTPIRYISLEIPRIWRYVAVQERQMSEIPKQPIVHPRDAKDQEAQSVAPETESDDQIRVVQSSLNELAKAKKTFDALRFNVSGINRFNEALKAAARMKSNPSVLESITRAAKALDGLRNNSPGADSLDIAGQTIQASMSNAAKAFTPDHIRSDRQPATYLATNKPRGRAILTPADFGVVLREARKAMGMTQQQFADAAGVGRRFVSECESGKPRLEFGKVIQVASAAGIDLLAQRR